MQLFIGYFRYDMDIKKAASFVKQACPKVKEFTYKSRRLGLNGSVLFLLASFENKKDALEAIKILDGKPFGGHPLVARLHEGRSASNERRNIHWRTQEWIGEERRKSERRYYKKHSTQTDQGISSFILQEDVAKSSNRITISDDETRAFLKMSIKNRKKQPKATDKESELPKPPNLKK
jgi:RNA recognition motif-containing protein